MARGERASRLTTPGGRIGYGAIAARGVRRARGGSACGSRADGHDELAGLRRPHRGARTPAEAPVGDTLLFAGRVAAARRAMRASPGRCAVGAVRGPRGRCSAGGGARGVRVSPTRRSGGGVCGLGTCGGVRTRVLLLPDALASLALTVGTIRMVFGGLGAAPACAAAPVGDAALCVSRTAAAARGVRASSARLAGGGFAALARGDGCADRLRARGDRRLALTTGAISVLFGGLSAAHAPTRRRLAGALRFARVGLGTGRVG